MQPFLNESNFKRLYDKYKHMHYVYALKLLKYNEFEANNVVLSVYTHLWINRVRITDELHLKKFVNVAIFNACMNVLKRNKRKIKFIDIYEYNLEECYIDPNPHENHMDQLYKLVKQEANKLPDLVKIVFKLVNIDCRTIADVSTLLNMKYNRARRYNDKAKKWLKNQLQSHYSELT